MQWLNRWMLAGLALFCLTGLAAAQAALQIIVGSATASSPSTGNTFEVSITNVGNAPSAPLAGFSFGISVPGGSGITFTNATILTALNPYLFLGQSSTPPFSNTAFPNQSFIATDLYATAGGVPVLPGQTFGLGLISFDVAVGSSDTTVTLAGFPATGLSDENGSTVDYDGFNGLITIAAVPEPATWGMIGLSTMAAAGLWYRQRRNQKLALEARLSKED
ncbi:MAG: PEP-CTERM sorting domain-containing protein [Planctomycetia bacterium]|nr:PEP-CTERM sorting domain-containing protein [Planctomycetia bacterium]